RAPSDACAVGGVDRRAQGRLEYVLLGDRAPGLSPFAEGAENLALGDRAVCDRAPLQADGDHVSFPAVAARSLAAGADRAALGADSTEDSAFRPFPRLGRGDVPGAVLHRRGPRDPAGAPTRERRRGVRSVLAHGDLAERTGGVLSASTADRSDRAGGRRRGPAP